MPNLETPPELAEWLADKLGIYGACPHVYDGGPECDGTCRPCWTSDIANRIRQATINEHMLAKQQRPNPPGQEQP